MSRIQISTDTGYPLGYIEESGDTMTAYTMDGYPLGKYSKASDWTTSMTGYPLTKGNVLSGLIYNYKP